MCKYFHLCNNMETIILKPEKCNEIHLGMIKHPISQMFVSIVNGLNMKHFKIL